MAGSHPRTMYYASVGPRLRVFGVDVEGAALTERNAVTLPANIQYAWAHPSRHILYAVSSNGGPGVAGDKPRCRSGNRHPRAMPLRSGRAPSMSASMRMADIC